MQSTMTPMGWMVLGFFVTAIVYASVGFGGGSTYTALLVLADTDYRMLPSIALICNLVVVTGGTLRFAREGLLDLRFALPFVVLSIPMAWFGGQLPIGKQTFLVALGIALIAAGLVMWGLSRRDEAEQGPVAGLLPRWSIGVPLGGMFGFLAGLVGIGGGIFLAPCLHLVRMASAKRIAATASFFIMVNSIAGLVGQTMKQGSLMHLKALSEHAWLIAAVLVGGQLGSHLGAKVLSPVLIRRTTATLIVIVGIRLLWM